MNVSIIGSCHSRDMFNSNFIENYKDYFNLQAYFSLTSMLSVMSKPVKYNHNNLIKSGLRDRRIERMYYELEKPELKVLESLQSDILLLDFYADARYGARFYEGEYIVSGMNFYKNKKIIEWNLIGPEFSYQKNRDEFMVIWKNSFDRFMAFVNDKLPGTEVVINTAKGTDTVMDEDGHMYISPGIEELNEELDVDAINRIWTEMDEYAINKYNLKALYFEKEYYLDKDYFFGLGNDLVHFHPEYYRDCFNKFLDISSKIEIKKKKPSGVNLLRDSVFSKGIAEWPRKKGRFETIEYNRYNGLRVVDCRKIHGEDYRPQLWSKPIKLCECGNTEYTLSFYFKAENPDLLTDGEVIFITRTFKTVSGMKVKEALEQQLITLDKSKFGKNNEYRHVVTFTPKGKFIRLSLYMFEYVPGIEYSRIKFERSDKVSEFTK